MSTKSIILLIRELNIDCSKCEGWGGSIHRSDINYNLEFRSCPYCAGAGIQPIPLSELR